MLNNTGSRHLKIFSIASIVALFVLCVTPDRFFSQSGSTFNADTVMTPAELRSTGVAMLTPSQRIAFNQWLASYTVRALRIGMDQACRDWDKESLDSISDDGRILTTDSGKILKVDAGDEVDTALWESSDDILTHCNRSNCTIINIDEQGEIAGATLLK